MRHLLVLLLVVGRLKVKALRSQANKPRSAYFLRLYLENRLREAADYFVVRNDQQNLETVYWNLRHLDEILSGSPDPRRFKP